MRRAHKVTIHCPLTQATFEAILSGDGSAMERDPVAAKMLAIIRADNPLGDFDLYKGVVEVALGLETFVPTPTASPALGAAGVPTISPSAIMTTYVDECADPAAVAKALGDLRRAHPWETPVIEVDEGWVRLDAPEVSVSRP